MRRKRLMGRSPPYSLWRHLPPRVRSRTAGNLTRADRSDPLTFISKATSAGVVFETTKGTKLSCKKATNTGEFTSQDAGLALIDLEECLSSTFPCNSPKDKSGVVLFLGSIQLADILPGGVLGLGIWIEAKEELPGTGDLHLECGGVVAIVILGSLLGKIDGVTSGVAFEEAKALWHQTKGEQEIKTCMTLKALCNEEKNVFALLMDFGKGHELTGEDAEVLINGFKKGGVPVKPVVDF